MKRIFILLLCALLLAGCGGKTGESGAAANTTDTVSSTDGDGAGDGEGETETETEDPEAALFQITKEENGGKTFTILTSDQCNYEFLADELTGELLNDAVYNRNLAVEELLDVKLDVVSKPGAYDGGDREKFWALVKGSVMANEGTYDIVCAMISCMQMYATPEYYLDINALSDVNLNNPWWITEMQNDLNIQGKLINVIGDMNISMYKRFAVSYANLDLLASGTGLDSAALYQMVRDGDWTFDALFSLANQFATDVNGDGKIDPVVDTVGLTISNVPFWTVQASFDLPMVTLDGDGLPYVVGLTDRAAYAADKLASAIAANPSVAITTESYDFDKQTASFAEGRSAFLLSYLDRTDTLREMEDNFAILPFPKLDNEQEIYRTLIATSTQMTYVPVTTNDPALTGKVLESLAYYGHKLVVPAYYDTALKDRYSRDPETRVMLELIREHAVLPFEYAYSTALEWPHTILANAILNNKAGSLASDVASKTKAWNNRIEKLMKVYN
ncbi:MAG: hypothetical protein MSH31_05605 [Clostridiales bacterium]|nr:hypothetical protein [Clostridiales bacterium]